MPKQQRKRQIIAQSLSFLSACKRWIIGEEDGSDSLANLADALVRGMEPLPIWAGPEPGLSFPLFWMPEHPLQQEHPLEADVQSPQRRRLRRSTRNPQRGLCVTQYAVRRSGTRRSSRQRRLLQHF